ncbi:hypothetical protein MMC09_004288 [Bachmanniomyces sp. S44760]|nr:hypothetical protein [Bachmanniomyces sp. S44760]
MEELQKKHRQEQRDLQSRVAQKKKSASKKTRKGVNAECSVLERELSERQDAEARAYQEDNQTLDSEEGVRLNIESNLSDEPAAYDPTATDCIEDIIEPMGGMTISEPSNHSSRAPKQNRQKARLARRAAEQEVVAAQAMAEAANMPDLRQTERLAMLNHMHAKGLVEKEIQSDGHCMYSAVADQVNKLTLAPTSQAHTTSLNDQSGVSSMDYKQVRKDAAAYVIQHPDDFVPFLEEPLNDYVLKIRDTGEWGGHLELLAISKTYDIEINVLQADGRVEKIGTGKERDIWLGYYRHSFGLGEHYNSLRKSLDLQREIIR